MPPSMLYRPASDITVTSGFLAQCEWRFGLDGRDLQMALPARTLAEPQGPD
jgi:hypothetical protein